MCTLIAKKFPNLGWVGIKNRDRPFSTRTELLRTQKHGIQKVALLDERTHWSEGMNSKGVCIISSSLSPDHSSTTSTTSRLHSSKNGARIRDALAMPTVEDAVHYLRANKATGFLLVFDQFKMYVIEGEFGTHKQTVKKITTDTVVRTNHGVTIPQAGYQRSVEDIETTLRRISSEARMLIGEYIANVAESPEQMMALMAKKWTSNTQLTTLRYSTDNIDVRTTEQLILEPKTKLMLVRNTDGILDFDQESANPPDSKILVGIVD